MDIIRKSNRPYYKNRLYKIGLTFLEICYDSVVKDQGIVALFCNNPFFCLIGKFVLILVLTKRKIYITIITDKNICSEKENDYD